MASLLSQSADLLAAHPHLFDGGLSRGLIYFATALLFGMRIWLALAPPLRPALTRVRWLSGLLGLSGLLLAFNLLALQAADPFGAESMAFFADPASYRQVMNSSFGLTWLACALFLSCALLWLHTPVAWLFAAGLAFGLAANSHAREQGIATWMFWIDAAHLGLGLSWFGGLFLLAGDRLGGAMQLGREEVLRWSRIALPLFLGILLLGLVRLGLALQAEGGLNVLYGSLLGLKVLAVVAVMFNAWKLRSVLGEGQGLDKRFDDYLTWELFSAFILVLMTALVTQLPPS